MLVRRTHLSNQQARNGFQDGSGMEGEILDRELERGVCARSGSGHQRIRESSSPR